MSPELTTALVGFIVVLTAILQSWHQRRKDRADTKEVKDQVEKVEKAVNGEGLGGQLGALIAWAKAHDEQDNQRHEDLTKEIRRGKPPTDIAPTR